MPLDDDKKPLTEDERKMLLAHLEEMKSRGLDVPKETLDNLKRKEPDWPIDENGYFIRMDGKHYTPAGEQGAFVANTARLSLFYGSRGSGKTGAGAQKALKKIMQGESGAVMNPDFENFKYSTWPELREWIPWDMVIPSHRIRKSPGWEPHQPFAMAFVNGAKMYCKGLKNPDSARGPNINWLWYDEAGRDETGMGWRIALASVRVGKNPQAWATETPKNQEHWSYKFFILKEIPAEALKAFASSSEDGKILVEAFHGTVADNKDNLDPAFYSTILASYQTGWMKIQEVDGEFANEGGKIGDAAWFKNKMVDLRPDNIKKRVRFWDLAATEKKQAKDDPDETVGTLIDKFLPSENQDWWNKYVSFVTNAKDYNFLIENQVYGWWAYDKLLEVILNTARYDGPYVKVAIEQEPASGGKNQIAAIRAEFKKYPELASHTVVEVESRKVGDRVLAANTHWFGVAAEGRMWMMLGGWNQKTLAQIDGFTQTLHDDRATSITGAMFELNPHRGWTRTPFVGI